MHVNTPLPLSLLRNTIFNVIYDCKTTLFRECIRLKKNIYHTCVYYFLVPSSRIYHDMHPWAAIAVEHCMDIILLLLSLLLLLLWLYCYYVYSKQVAQMMFHKFEFAVFMFKLV